MAQGQILRYCNHLFQRSRLETKSVKIGIVTIGSEYPISIQSMTTVDTMNTQGSIEESIRMIENGCEIVRLTAPSKKEAENLLAIKKGLVNAGYNTPLVADIHFTPNAAEIAAKYVEKVRINPGNYADKKKFQEIEYTDASYQKELIRIEEKFLPLVKICKQNGTAMRIGTNHGSLSDRILSRYGDTPEGMVASAIEFLDICKKHHFHNVVLSMKASNTIVMVQAYRLLVAEMLKSGDVYPIHLGVTEAGDGEDGRIKSAVGIGALLEDGIGDTIRVSLTEKPEAEIPVAKKLLEKYTKNALPTYPIKTPNTLFYNPFSFNKRHSNQTNKIGGSNVPVVIADLSTVTEIKPSHFFGFGYNYSVPLDKWNIADAAADFVYTGKQEINFAIPGTIQIICDFETWNKHQKPNHQPIINKKELQLLHVEQFAFIRHDASDDDISYLQQYPNITIILESKYKNTTQLFRLFLSKLKEDNILNPVVLTSTLIIEDPETYQLWTSAELGSLYIDGFGDGIWLQSNHSTQLINTTSFGILQATRTRTSKTEYISCPSCGRTLFDLQETTAKIRAKTSHLKGLKIGIMGCIVNGPGEMADADYGYVGTGPGKIHLYKEKTVMRKNIPEADAVQALIDLIREHGDWIEKEEIDHNFH
jgi:(E)-4-hydroxy-3-methylbut-2-enyl-diphosphate synthase